MILDSAETVTEALPELQRRLGLTHWDVTVPEQPADEDYDAYIVWVPGAREAKLLLGPDWAEKTDESRLHTIVHELVHLHLADICDAISKDLPKLLGEPMFLAFWGQWERQMEHATNAISKAWAKELEDGRIEQQGAEGACRERAS